MSGFSKLAAQAALVLPFYYYLPQKDSLPYPALAALSMFAVPISYERCFQKKVVALRWIVFMFLGAYPCLLALPLLMEPDPCRTLLTPYKVFC